MPKGIAVSHGAVIDFISHFTQTFSITKEDRLGNQAPFDFDVSVKDIYSCVMTGATLVLIPRTYFSAPPLLLDYLCDRHVTSLTWAVSALTIISSLGGLKYRVPTEIKACHVQWRGYAEQTVKTLAGGFAGRYVCQSLRTIGDHL